MPSLQRTQIESLPRISTPEQLASSLQVSLDELETFSTDPGSWYTEFSVPKSSGGVRVIRPPRKPLRRVQKSFLRLLYSRLKIPPYLHGGVPKRSIFTHAKTHVGRAMVATLDVKCFFPSVRPELVSSVFERAGIFGDALAMVLAITTLDNGVPQGAPTSSLLANMAFGPVDAAIISLCRKRRLSYSRYVDDIAVSGLDGFAELKGPFVEKIGLLGFEVAEHKLHFLPASKRQVVTGLVVNEKMRPTSEFVVALKTDIRSCLDVGVAVVADSEGISVGSLRQHLSGRVSHLAAADRKLGKKLRGMLCGVDWRRSHAA